MRIPCAALEEKNEIRIVVAEDSQAGLELWSRLEHDLAQTLAPRSLSVTVAQNAAELLMLLASLERAARRPDMVLIDLHVDANDPLAALGGGR